MRYPVSNPHDAEVNRFHRMRSVFGAVILVSLATGFAALPFVTPPAPEHLSVNCVDPHLGSYMTDAATGLTGCATPPARPQRPEKAVAAPPAIAEDAKADDPPISTF